MSIAAQEIAASQATDSYTHIIQMMVRPAFFTRIGDMSDYFVDLMMHQRRPQGMRNPQSHFSHYLSPSAYLGAPTRWDILVIAMNCLSEAKKTELSPRMETLLRSLNKLPPQDGTLAPELLTEARRELYAHHNELLVQAALISDPKRFGEMEAARDAHSIVCAVRRQEAYLYREHKLFRIEPEPRDLEELRPAYCPDGEFRKILKKVRRGPLEMGGEVEAQLADDQAHLIPQLQRRLKRLQPAEGIMLTDAQKDYLEDLLQEQSIICEAIDLLNSVSQILGYPVERQPPPSRVSSRGIR